MAKIVIIGAGLTGLSAAYHFEKRGFFDYRLFEQENEVGGLCRSIISDGFTFDFTGHLLHTSDPYFRSFIAEIMGLEHLNQITRQSFIYSHNTYTRYPYQINLHGLPLDVIAECIEGFVNRHTFIKKPQSFFSWVLKTFGPGFGKHFFFPYQKKIFSYDVKKLSASWTGRFVPSTSLKHIIAGALADNADDDIGYNAQFFYPKQGGIFRFVHAIARHLKNPIHTAMRVTAIDMRTKTVHFHNGHVEPFEQLITTMPLDTLLTCLKERPSTSFKQAISHLRCGSVVNFNLGIGRDDFQGKHWIYFPEPQYPFYRIGFPHNLAHTMAPHGSSSLYGEFSHMKKPTWWVSQALKKAINETKTLFSIANHEIQTEQVNYLTHAYVTYDAWRDAHLARLLERLKEYDVHSVGRYGAWKYSSMQEAILDGKGVAETLTIVPATKTSLYRSYKKPSQKECE